MKRSGGDVKNAGRAGRPAGRPESLQGHDVLIPEQGTAIPSGVDDLTRHAGWVSVGIDPDTAGFAVRTIGRWWQTIARPRYRRARSLLITADAGDSDGVRDRLWKWELQQLANRTGLTITTCYVPPGTRKWTTIEHRLCSSISRNGRGQPASLAVIVNLIGGRGRPPGCACGASGIAARTRRAAPSRTSSSLPSGSRPISFMAI